MGTVAVVITYRRERSLTKLTPKRSGGGCSLEKGAKSNHYGEGDYAVWQLYDTILQLRPTIFIFTSKIAFQIYVH